MENQNVALEAEHKTEQPVDIRELDLEELCAVYGGIEYVRGHAAA